LSVQLVAAFGRLDDESSRGATGQRLNHLKEVLDAGLAGAASAVEISAVTCLVASGPAGQLGEQTVPIGA
jgi:ferritin-like metal-binding protein YciE